jgi:ABC-type glycerol-3-phosphate transport system permease component
MFDAHADTPLSRFSIKGKNCFFCSLITMMIPFHVLMIPLLSSVHLGLLNTYGGLFFPYADHTAIF